MLEIIENRLIKLDKLRDKKVERERKSYDSVKLLLITFNSASNINVDGPINYWTLKDVNNRESKTVHI